MSATTNTWGTYRRAAGLGPHGGPARMPSRTSARVTLVTGPPCGGKNTYVAQHRAPGDLVVDLDALWQAVGGAGNHDHPRDLQPFAFEARDAVLARLWSGRHDVRQAWIILTAPSRADRAPYRANGCRVVMCLAAPDVLVERASRERPSAWLDHVREWLARHDREDVDEVIDSTPAAG